MGQAVPIDSILTNRTLEPDDDLTKLIAHIGEHGLQVPVLVSYDMTLIDGLRRMEACRALGKDTIDVTSVTLYMPAISWIKRAHDHAIEAKPPSYRRIWEMYEACRPLMNISRSQAMRGNQYGRGVRVGGRTEFAQAIGMEKEAYLQVIIQLYRTAQEPTREGRLAREAAERLDRGEITPYMAMEYVRRNRGPTEPGDPVEQLSALKTAAATLTGIRIAVNKFGPLSPELKNSTMEMKYVMKELLAFRRSLYQLIRQLERELQ